MIKKMKSLLEFRSLLTLLACSGVAVFSQAQSTFDWNGSVSGSWDNANNWTPATDAPPGTNDTDIARFNAASPNTAVNLASGQTISSIQFTAGATSYEFSGSALSFGSGTAITNSSGNTQTFNNTVNFDGNAALDIASGSTVVLAGTIDKSSGYGGNLSVDGGGLLHLKGTFANFTTFTNITARNGSTIIFDTTNSNGANNYVADGGRIDINRSTGTSGISIQLRGTGGEAYIIRPGFNLGTATVRFHGDDGNGKTLTFGSNFSGEGTATYSGTVSLNRVASGSNQTYRLYAAEENILSLTGVVSDSLAPGSGTKVEITGLGTVRFAGSSSNTSVTPIEITNGATLELAKTGGAVAIADGGHVTINSGGLLRYSGSDQIDDGVAITFDGGTIYVGSFNDSVGALTVGTLGGSIDFDGLDGSITFASLAGIDGTFTISGWGQGGSIYFLNGDGLTPEALSHIYFDNYGPAAYDSSTGLLYAIPEPATTATALGMVVMMGAFFLRRRS